MPTPETILSGLQSQANSYPFLALFWHLIIPAIAAFIASGWRPSNRCLSSFMALPAFSVGILAWIDHNPFNGTLFSILGIVLALVGFFSQKNRTKPSSAFFQIPGIFLLFIGLIYPHFTPSGNILSYLYSTPAGIIPCPSLMIIIGFSLIMGGFQSKLLPLLLAGYGLFYGLFGVIRLGVSLDWFLVAGSILLLTLRFWGTTHTIHPNS